jgi:hypothetical protein
MLRAGGHKHGLLIYRHYRRQYVKATTARSNWKPISPTNARLFALPMFEFDDSTTPLKGGHENDISFPDRIMSAACKIWWPERPDNLSVTARCL